MQYDDETLRRLQLAELDILIAIDKVCRERNITYFLDSGTALGARRHAGFIPWDDDIDIAMPREDYERFLAIAQEALGDEYVVADPNEDDRLAGLFAKVWKRGTKFFTDETIEAGVDQGIFVDVFPYDRVFADPAHAKKQLKDCLFWQSISYLYHSKAINVPHKGALGAIEKLGCRAVHAVASKAVSPQVIGERFAKAATAARDDDQARELACMNYVNSGSYPIEILLPPVDVYFEGHAFPGPADMDAYLEHLYGKTWSELPPVENRRNHAPRELDFGERPA